MSTKYEGLPIVDTHAHVIDRSIPFEDTSRHQQITYDATLEQYLGQLDAHGISYGVLTQGSVHRDNNTFLVNTVSENLDRLRGTATLYPNATRSHVALLRDSGIVGIRYNWIQVPVLPDLHSEEWVTLLKLFADFDLHVEIQLEGQRWPGVLAALKELNLKVVADHFGRPDPVLGLSCPGYQALRDTLNDGRTWVKLSAAYRLGSDHAKAYADGYLQAGGPAALVWGSDWPWHKFESQVSMERCLADFEYWIEKDEDRRQILSMTPIKLFEFNVDGLSLKSA